LPPGSKGTKLSRSGLLIFRIGPASEAVAGTVTFRSGKKIGGRHLIFGRRAFTAEDGQAIVVRVKLSRRKQSLLGRLRRIRCEAVIHLRDGAGNASRRTYLFTLRSGRRVSG
jgi:hypothetical protein